MEIAKSCFSMETSEYQDSYHIREEMKIAKSCMSVEASEYRLTGIESQKSHLRGAQAEVFPVQETPGDFVDEMKVKPIESTERFEVTRAHQ